MMVQMKIFLVKNKIANRRMYLDNTPFSSPVLNKQFSGFMDLLYFTSTYKCFFFFLFEWLQSLFIICKKKKKKKKKTCMHKKK